MLSPKRDERPRQIAERADASLRVQLLLGRQANTLEVMVRPVDRGQIRFGLRVPIEHAFDVFDHPYAYVDYLPPEDVIAYEDPDLKLHS